MTRSNLLTGIAIFAIVFALSFAIDAQEYSTDRDLNVVLASEIKWEQLNPKRGDASPKAANIWGDRNSSNPTGFLVKFADGFSSPPHIHNVTYRGVVLRGLVHNDDPDVKPMWMPKGSYWTQPAGEVHITSAKGHKTMAYIEIEKGPYLVLPTDQAFDQVERSVNVDSSNIVWLDGLSTTWLESKSEQGPKISFLWGKPIKEKLNGSLLNLPGRFSGTLIGNGNIRAVVIDGTVNYQRTKDSKTEELEPGSYFGSNGEAKHQLSCKSGNSCLVYVRSIGKYTLTTNHNENNQHPDVV